MSLAAENPKFYTYINSIVLVTVECNSLMGEIFDKFCKIHQNLQNYREL